MTAQSKGRHATGHDARLIELARADLEPRADAERVVLAAAGSERRELHLHAEVGVAPVVAQQVDAVAVAEEDILIAVAVEVGDQQRPNRIVLHLMRQYEAGILEAFATIVVK